MWYVSVDLCANTLWPGVTLSSTRNTSLVVEAIALHIRFKISGEMKPHSLEQHCFQLTSVGLAASVF